MWPWPMWHGGSEGTQEPSYEVYARHTRSLCLAWSMVSLAWSCFAVARAQLQRRVPASGKPDAGQHRAGYACASRAAKTQGAKSAHGQIQSTTVAYKCLASLESAHTIVVSLSVSRLKKLLEHNNSCCLPTHHNRLVTRVWRLEQEGERQVSTSGSHFSRCIRFSAGWRDRIRSGNRSFMVCADSKIPFLASSPTSGGTHRITASLPYSLSKSSTSRVWLDSSTGRTTRKRMAISSGLSGSLSSVSVWQNSKKMAERKPGVGVMAVP